MRLFGRIGTCLRGAALLLCLASGPSLARAQVDLDSTVPCPDGRFRVAAMGDQLILYDNILARTLIGGAHSSITLNTPLRPTVQMTPRAGGMDLVFTYINDTPEAVPLGWINFSGVRFAGNCRQWAFGQDTFARVLPGYNLVGDIRYPQEQYCPVMAISDNRHTLAMSIHYPIVEYNHNVLVSQLGVPVDAYGSPGQTWTMQFKFEATIPPGASRTYTIAIRAVTADKHFLYALQPYRDYFRSLYGPVDYNRDPRPISGENISMIAWQTSNNPRGFNSALRPDERGWGPWVTNLLNVRNFGYKRVMLWCASGTVPAETNLNFPWRFMTPLNDFTPSRDSMNEFQRLRAGGVELGFWWGNNACLMRGWGDQITGEYFDPDNAEHVRLAYAELDMAVSAGASMIGLDAFKQRLPGNMYRWLKMMKEHAPNVKYITENAAPDFIHNLAPTFHEAHIIKNPHVMADFLNPGHEIWAAISSTPESRSGDRPATPAEIVREVNRVATLGYVPLIYGRPNVRSTVLAAESWNRTIPRDLRLPMTQPGRLAVQPAIRRRLGPP